MAIENDRRVGHVGLVVVNAPEASGMHADVVSPRDVGAFQVPHMDRLRRAHTKPGQGLLEDLAAGLGNPDFVREAQDLEELE